MTPDEICRALSERMDALMTEHFPEAKKSGASWSMGDLDGAKGKSTGVFRGPGGIYFAKDRATDESVNVLGLLHRKLGLSWAETLAWAKKTCGISDVKPVSAKIKPRRPSLKLYKMRGKPPYNYLVGRGIQELTQQKYQVRWLRAEDLPPTKQLRWNEDYVAFPFVDTKMDYVMCKWLGLERKDDAKEIGSTYPQYATLWTWQVVDDNTREIVICEGEIDAMSIAQMTEIPALSMPAGSSNLDWIDNDYERLFQFEKIYLLTDMDAAGEQAAQKIAKRLGLTRCFRVSLPTGYKDANDYLLSKEHGKPRFEDLLFASKTNDPKELRAASDYSGGVLEEIERFTEERAENDFLWPELPFRFRRGEMTVITGYPGGGKSQLTYQMVLHEMLENKRRTCIASFEIPAQNMLFNLLWMLNGRSPKSETVADELNVFGDLLWFVESDADDTASWPALKEDFVYANRRFGCDLFVVDALMHVSKKGDAEGTDLVAKQAAKFCVVNDSSLALICHADAKKKGNDHIPEVEDVLGGQGIGGAAHNVMSVWRNKKKERDAEEKGTDLPEVADGKLYISKQRSTGKTVFRNLWFGQKTRKFYLAPEDVDKAGSFEQSRLVKTEGDPF